MEQCRVGRTQESARIELVIRVDTGPDADADQKLPLLNEQRLLKRAHEGATGACNLLHAAGALLDDSEFIAPQASGESAKLGRLAQALRDPLQDQVAKRVSHAVIDVLEIVEIKEKHANLRAVARCVLKADIQVRE